MHLYPQSLRTPNKIQQIPEVVVQVKEAEAEDGILSTK